MILDALKRLWTKELLFKIEVLEDTERSLRDQIVRLKDANAQAWGIYYALKDRLEEQGFRYNAATMSYHNDEKDCHLYV